MASHLLLQPSMVLSAADRIPLHLRRTLYMVNREEMIIVRVVIFADRDAGTLAAPDLTILDNPALGPVRSDHAVLVSSRRRPCRCCLVDIEAGHRNVSDAVLLRQEALSAHRNFNILLRRIRAAEISIQNGLIRLLILLRIPFAPGCLRVPGARIDISRFALLQRTRLIQRFIVEPDTSGVLVSLCKIPVAEHIGRIRIIGPECTVADPAHPYISLVVLPALQLLCTGDFRPQRLRTAVGNPCILRTRMHRLDILPVYARCYEHLIPRHSHPGSLADSAKRRFL